MPNKYLEVLKAASSEANKVLRSDDEVRITQLSNSGQKILSDIHMLLTNPVTQASAEDYLHNAINYIAFQALRNSPPERL